MKNKKAIGAGILMATAAAAAGYYFYASKDAKKHRKVAAKWATDLQKDVMKRAQNLKNLDRATISAIVEQSTRAYKGIRNLDSGEVERAAKELKNNWEKIAGEIKKGRASTTAAAKRMGKRAKGAMKEATGAMKKTQKLVRKMAS